LQVVTRIDHIFLAVLTRNDDDAGTRSQLNLTINIDGVDVYDKNLGLMGTGSTWLSGGFGGPHDQGDADIQPNTLDRAEIETEPFGLSALTNSSIRLAIRDDDAWKPQHVLILGKAELNSEERGRVIALAVETDLEEHWLSTDSEEGHLSMPLRLVSSGSSSTMIRRILLLVSTYSGADVGTDNDIELQISAAGNTVVSGNVPDSPNDDREEYTANWYFLPVLAPFTRDDVLSNGGINLRIHGNDAWLPGMVYVYGLDTAEGRPTEIVHLSSVPDWEERSEFGWLSNDPSEGKDSYPLPLN
jgi:hypothetical protein